MQTEFENKVDQFGIVNGIKKLEEGWLSKQTEIRLNISSPQSHPFFSSKNSVSLSNLSIKPVVYSTSNTLSISVIKPCQFQNITDIPAWGVPVPSDENSHLSCIIKTYHPNNIQVLLEFYNMKNGNLVATSIVTSEMFTTSKGILENPLLDPEWKAIASIRLPYMVIQPHTSLTMSMKHCYLQHWKPRPCVYAGHRGSGNSFTSEKVADVFENTIASFNKASQHGAQYVEFDVHLTMDKVPVVYHDLTTCVSAQKNDGSTALLKMRVCDMSLKELQTFRMNHRSRINSNKKLELDQCNSQQDHLPFPTLEQVFNKVEPQTGFNIEVKWPTLDMNNNYEDGLDKYFDANEFVDAILTTVFKHAHDRRVIFSCFDVDICIMLRRKQNKYPVLLLTNGNTMFYVPMLDLRERTNDMAIGTALSERFLGIDTLEKDVYEMPDIIKKCHDVGLIFACYGDDVGENLQLMQEKSVDIAIFDRVYEKGKPMVS
uniref:Glycerophosphocholine phosphodiesterase GPCPD1-like n=1 Tax=Phallusia mammillata TaxID=59560 RepID=A0A6F9DD84_9ASCI|nr:glycerophosphocholine phosphodiesterase GPCPD1-like [Phallusia mammillata]